MCVSKMKIFLNFLLFLSMSLTINANARSVDDGTFFKSDETGSPCLKSSTHVLSKRKKEKSGWSVFLDQDFLVINPENDETNDRNYTMGFGLSISGVDNSKGVLASSRDWFDKYLMTSTDDSSTIIESMHTTTYGMAVYTPDDLENEFVIQGDRPYASLLYVSNSKLKAYKKGESTETTFMIGVLGLDVAKEIQEFAHNNLNASNEKPLGWDNQISEGGELTALYSVKKKTLVSSCYVANKMSSDISYSLSADVGYMVNAAIGLDMRWGYIGTPYYLHTTTPVSNYNYYSCYDCKVHDNYFFLNFGLRAVAYNATLQGQFRDSKLTIDSQDVENITFETSLGWVYSLNSEWKIAYAINYKSKEFKGSEAEDHLYGGLYLSKRLVE